MFKAVACGLFLAIFLAGCAPAGTYPFGQDPDIVKPEKPLIQDTTYTNEALGLSFTIPRGWLLTSGDPGSESCSFAHRDRALSFHFSSTAMSASFPVTTSVRASLNVARDDMEQGMYSLVERLDKEGESRSCMGWLTEDGIPGEEQGENPSRRIIWQCYDQDKNYISITVSAPAATFDRYRDTLLSIMDSVTFQ